MTDTSGPTSPRQFAFYDRDSSCWRTWPAISLWGSETYSATWPKRGMTRSGAAFELPTPAHPIDGSACSLLPTPTARDHKGRNQRDDATCLPGAVATLPTGDRATAWGRYEPAIRRWEHVLGRPAPAPTDDRRRLNPRFVEWMMGLPDGWVTDVPGLTRTAQLKALGNGVVPQQARLAWEELL